MNNWNNLKPESRLWIYGAIRELEEGEIKTINQMLDEFCDTWAGHGSKLNCGFNVMYNRFILLAVDEESAAASGCSIDESMGIIQRIDKELNLDLFNRLRCYHVEETPHTKVTPYLGNEVVGLLESGALDQESRMVHMQALRIYELMPNFTKALRETWLRKYLNVERTG